MKLVQLLSLALNCSRRKASQFINRGLIEVNSQVVYNFSLMLDLNQELKVRFGGKLLNLDNLQDKYYFIFHKPPGMEITSHDPALRKILQKIGVAGLKPVGRLDLDSEGLLILTNDGNLADQLIHPKGKIKKVYEVWVKGLSQESTKLAQKQIQTLKEELQVSVISWQKGKLKIILQEGQNRQIRRACAKVGLFVERLLRIQLGTVQLGSLPLNCYKTLSVNLIQRLKDELTNSRTSQC